MQIVENKSLDGQFSFRLDFHRSLVSFLPEKSSGEERRLLSRTVAGNWA